MPVRIKKVDGYQVSSNQKTPYYRVHAKRTSKKKAKRQARLLRAVEHGWKPTGRRAIS